MWRPENVSLSLPIRPYMLLRFIIFTRVFIFFAMFLNPHAFIPAREIFVVAGPQHTYSAKSHVSYFKTKCSKDSNIYLYNNAKSIYH